MQQPGQFRFLGKIKRRGKLPGEFGDVGQMRGERLPLARGFW